MKGGKTLYKEVKGHSLLNSFHIYHTILLIVCGYGWTFYLLNRYNLTNKSTINKNLKAFNAVRKTRDSWLDVVLTL